LNQNKVLGQTRLLFNWLFENTYKVVENKNSDATAAEIV
jgi:hypothetical protein